MAAITICSEIGAQTIEPSGFLVFLFFPVFTGSRSFLIHLFADITPVSISFLKKYLLSLFIWPCHLSCSMWHLPCGMWDLSIVACKLLVEACEILVPWPRIKPGPPALGTPSVSYCTIREVLPPAIICQYWIWLVIFCLRFVFMIMDEIVKKLSFLILLMTDVGVKVIVQFS